MFIKLCGHNESTLVLEKMICRLGFAVPTLPQTPIYQCVVAPILWDVAAFFAVRHTLQTAKKMGFSKIWAWKQRKMASEENGVRRTELPNLGLHAAAVGLKPLAAARPFDSLPDGPPRRCHLSAIFLHTVFHNNDIMGKYHRV